uniref:AT-rich interactive domain-containing protein 5B n=1 Tax=Daphnia magna TaxID=35525 RepID=A0A0P5FTU0_9CRUS
MAAIKHNGLSHQGSCSNSSNGSNNGSVMSDCHVTADGDSSPGFEWVGASCGHHGTYTFYKAVKLSTSMHRRVLALGDFFFVKMWTDQEIVSIGELQLLWEDDKFPVHNNGHHHHNQPSSSPLASLKLYFLPENTPDGRHEEHGEDEVVSISEKVVLKISDLATWLVDDVKWEKGAPSVWERQCPTPPPSPPDSPDAADATEGVAIPPTGANIGVLDMRDVIKEKQSIGDATGSSNVLVLSYPAYCRYRSTLKRLEGHNQTDYMRQAVVEAIGGRAAPCPNTRVVFCKDTFDYPELEDHELLCNHLAPKWKGRPRKMLKKRSHSPGSESNESESSVSTVTSSYRSKDSPMKPGIRNVPTPYRAGDRPKGEQVFMQKLHKFMAGQGTPIGRLPSLGFKQLDLFLFYTKVQRAGGYEAAVANKQWKGIYIELGGHPSNTSAATCTRRHYEKLLLPYERYATSLAVEESTTASTSVATPPKKRKISDVSDLPFEVPVEMKEQLKAAAESTSLNLAGLMAAGDRANLLAAFSAAAASGDSKQLSALGDFARYAQQLDATSGSAAKLNRNKESKNHAGSGEVSKDGDIRRPSVIQKNSVDGRTSKSGQQSSGSSSAQPTELGSPPPAHSQKPVTLPSIPAGEVPASEQLRQWYAQMLSDKATGGNPLPASAAAMLELTLRPPAPAAATPSIFVPSRRIYVDPNLDIKKNRNSTALAAGSSSAIPAAHSKLAIQSSNKMSPTPINTGPPPLQNITPPRPAASRPVAAQTNHVRGSTAPQSLAPAARPAAIPLVDLTSRSINNMKAEDHHSSRKASQPFGAHPSSQMEMNGKPLLDLSAHQQNKLPGLPKWNSSPRSGDVSISLNVKIDGVGSDAKTSSGASSSNAQQRHSVSVVPLVKEEMSNSRQHRKEKEMMRMDRVSVTPQQQQQQQHQHQQQQQQQLLQQPQAQPQAQPQSYPRMVDSLVTMNASSSGASSVTKSGPIMASSHYGGSSSSGSSKPTTSSSSAGLHAGYPALLDPALASYYSSFYSSHMYNLPAGAFMAAAAAAAPPQLQHTPTSSAMFHHHHHQQMMQSSAAAEVTAQVYKDMIQRGYPPALAPVLPPGLSGLPGLSSLGSFAASMYSPMGGGKDSTPAERSLPKS